METNTFNSQTYQNTNFHDEAFNEEPTENNSPVECDKNKFCVTAPDENTWYHGRLDRCVAEERLLQAGVAGSYLIRESERKHGSYVLSYFGKSGINHFRVTAVCGDFYIGGRQFHSLNDLVSYYTYCSDLLKKEKLIYPVSPPEPVNDKRRIVAVLPYTKMPDTDELSFQKGDIFFIHNDMGDGWLWVTAHRTGEQGMIFRELVQDLDDNIDPNTVFGWFHPSVSKTEAVDMLVKAGPGSYLVRPSDNSPGDYSLFFHINNQIQRFRIEKRGVRYLMGGRTFECLDAIINRYQKEHIVEGHALGYPCCRTTNEVNGGGGGSGSFPVEREEKQRNVEKVYTTLRECREQVGAKKNKGIKIQSYLHVRNEKSKKWKVSYFVLLSVENEANDIGGKKGDSHLYYYDSPKRTKPKGLIDLCCAYLYQAHDSMFERPFCFQLVERALPCIATVTYLSANSAEDFQNWITTLRSFCTTQIPARISKSPRLRELRCLQLHILDTHRLPQKLVPSPYFVISLNQVKMAKSKVKTTGISVSWDEEFIFDDIPPDIYCFVITLYNKGKRSKDTEMAECNVDLGTLPNGHEHEEWYPLTGVTPVGEWGTVRLRLRYLHDLIMPLEEYSPLKQLILDPDLEAVKALSTVCHLDRIPLGNTLFKIFLHERKLADLMILLNDVEIEKEEETSTLFRGASLSTTIMDIYMKSTCSAFLKTALENTVCKLLESKISCELNPNKVSSVDEACTNAEFLLQVLDEIVLSIFKSADACPRTLRHVFWCLQKSVVGKWPNERLARARVISGFIFLRLLCPAVLNPHQFNLIPDPPTASTTRSLVMVAKCLQNLANLVEFGGKEPYMEVVNPFILKNKERMIGFLDQLSNMPENIGVIEENYSKQDIARELAVLHHICTIHLAELTAFSSTQTSVKKLVTVTEMLNKHKQKYQELMK